MSLGGSPQLRMSIPDLIEICLAIVDLKYTDVRTGQANRHDQVYMRSFRAHHAKNT
jgi:hypothetical protein